MKTAILIKIIKMVIGKNSAHIARKVSTSLGGFLMAPAVLQAIQGGEITPDWFQPIDQAQIEDGLTAGELIRTMIGFVLFHGTRAMSFFRARNLDWAADWVGIFIGRSIHSLYRAMLTATAGMLTWIGFSGGTAETAGTVPVVEIIGALIAVALAGISSSKQDGKLNPVFETKEKRSPKRNRLW